jgi:NADPH:quinone reductase-like Zn-dependent oxidoreductase
MKAIAYEDYGSADVLELREVAQPVVQDDDVLVRVHAASVNPIDWHFMRGRPLLMRAATGLRRPTVTHLGLDLAGRVEAVGKNVTQFRAGDEVFGAGKGTLAEYARATEKSLALKPAEVTFEQAAAVAVAGLTALQGLRDKGCIGPGHRVLINGAAGGVGTFAVQIARSFGADVTGVCSTRNIELVRSLGAGQVIDYTREDFTRSGRRYDLMLDMIGNHSLAERRRVLTPGGALVLVGGSSENPWFGPLADLLKAVLLAPFVSQRLAPILTRPSREDLVFLQGLLAAGKVTPVIDRTYPLSEAPEALAYLEAGHARGKVIISVA